MNAYKERIHDAPAYTCVDGQHVVELKPDGAEVHMTPAAAIETAQGLIEAAAKAEGERRLCSKSEDSPIEQANTYTSFLDTAVASRASSTRPPDRA